MPINPSIPQSPNPSIPPLGYHMPPEWSPHRGTWLSWPHRESSWPGKFEAVPVVFARMVRELASHEEVHINVTGPEMEEEVRALLQDQGIASLVSSRAVEPSTRRAAEPPSRRARVFFHHNPTNDACCRDHGPCFIHRVVDDGKREEAIVDWGYNAWGGKYPPFDADDAIPTLVGEELGIPVFHPGIVMEGGSLDVNGAGTLLTTESCLLNPNRNPTLGKAEIERYLKDYLGVTHILWLGDGIAGDDTDGHIDDLSRFTDASTIVTVVEPDPRDVNHAPLAENLARLKAMRDQDGRPFRIVTLPMPPPLYYDDQRLPASYANFYIANDIVLMPAYDPKTDAIARATLQQLLAPRQVIPLDSVDLVWGLGSFHCVTQQWPAV